MPSRIQEDDDDAGALRPSFSLPRSENTSTTEEIDDSSLSSTDPISARPKTKKSTEGDVLHRDHEYLFSFDGSSVLRTSHDSKIKGKKKKKNVRSGDKRSMKAGRSATTTYNTAQNEMNPEKEVNTKIKKTTKPNLLRPTDPKSDVDNSKVASLTPSPLPLTSMPKKKSNIEDTLEAMFREKNDKLDTLEAMFAAPWNRELLDAVLQHEKGNMQNTCDRILNHGVQDPRLLLEQLKASGGGPEESQVVQELVPQKHDVNGDRNQTGRGNDDDSDATKKTINSVKSNGIICNKVKNSFPDPGRKRAATSSMGARQLIAITDEEGGESLQMVATTIQQQQQHPHISPWECTGMWAGLPARTMDGKDQNGLRDAETGDCSTAIDDEVDESFYEMGDRFSSMHGKAPTYTFDDQPPSLGVGRGGSIDSSHIFIDSGEEEDQDQYSGIWSYPATSVAPGQIRSTSTSSSSNDIESQQEVASALRGLEEEEEDLVSEEREPRRSRKVLIGSPSILCELPNTSSSTTSYSSSSANTADSFVYNKEERALPPPKEDKTRASLATTTTPKTKKTKEDRFEDEEEQPVITPKTSRTSSSSSFPSPSPSGHKIVIENKSKGGNGGGSFMKKLTCIIILGLLCTLGYFIYKWLSIPELEEQIQKLESEVNRLTGQVDRLEEENDRYATLNDELNSTVQDLYIIKDDLNTTTNRLSVINDELNATNQEFQIRIDELTLQNQQYQDLNDELNNTVAELGSHINEFQAEIATLIIQNAQLGNYTNELESVVGNLEDIANEQNVTLQALHVGFGILTEQNNRLEELNDELELIVGFLNETSLGIDESLEDVTDFLAEQITTSRLLLLTNIETSYQSKISNWDCDYRDVYREKPFGTDFNLIIPPKEIPNLIEYVDNRILSDLCLSRTNFQNYLTIQYGDDNLTSNRLVAGVSNYVSAALDWYFDNNSNNISNDSNGSENGNENVGISQEEWAAAGYQCENLEVSFLFPIRTPFIWD